MIRLSSILLFSLVVLGAGSTLAITHTATIKSCVNRASELKFTKTREHAEQTAKSVLQIKCAGTLPSFELTNLVSECKEPVLVDGPPARICVTCSATATATCGAQ